MKTGFLLPNVLLYLDVFLRVEVEKRLWITYKRPLRDIYKA